jgi:hypothetical protein
MTPAKRGRRGDHLGETELVDLLDGTLPAPRMEHAGGCDVCRDQADALRSALRAAADADVEGEVPEPPPFFGAQLSARVRDAVADEPRPGVRVWHAGRPRAAWWAAVAAAAALILAVGLWRLSPPDTPLAPAPALAETMADAGRADGALNDVELDEDWALVRSVADGLSAESIAAAGVVARPGSAEGMALRLTDAERRELARLLEDEIARAASPESSS